MSKSKRKLQATEPILESETPKKRAKLDSKPTKKPASSSSSSRSVKSLFTKKNNKSSKSIDRIPETHKKVKDTPQTAASKAAPSKSNGGSTKNGAKATSKENILADKTPFPEKPESQDRIIEASLYEYLGSEDDELRLQAAATIISKLLDGEGVSESVLDKHLEKRLFRGLASSRKASRLGFSVVLSEIMSQLWGENNLCATRYRGLTFAFVLDTLTEKTRPVGNISGQEERDHYFGQLFGIECFVRSKVLFADVNRWHIMLSLLRTLAAKKTWLKSHCAWVIVQAASQMYTTIAEETLQTLIDAGWGKTPEGVAIWIVLQERFPSMRVPSKPWQDPLATKSLQELSKALREAGKQESSGTESEAQKSSGQFSAQLHFVWDIILSHFIRASRSSPEEVARNFKQFWDRVVDEGFFSKNASEPQKFTGFMVFTKFLEGGAAYPFVLDSLYTPHLIACLMNQAVKQDRYLHRAATKSLASIEKVVESKPECLLTVLGGLLGPHGAYNLDQRTNGKTIEKLLQNTCAEDATKVIALLKQVVVKTESDDIDKRHIVFVDYMHKLCGNSAASGRALVEIVYFAYPDNTKPRLATPESLQKLAATRLQSALAKLLKSNGDPVDLCRAVLSIEPTSAVKADDGLYSELTEARKTLELLISSESSLSDSTIALAPLHAVGILQLYDEEGDALEILRDLRSCHERLVTDSAGSDGEGVMEFLIEIILSMVAKNSPLMRQTTERVFEQVSGLMTTESLSLLNDTLAAKEDQEGMQALFDGEDDFQEEDDGDDTSTSDEDESDSDDLGSDVEIVDLPENNGDDDDQAASSDEDDTSSSGDSDGGSNEDNQQTNQIIQIDDKLANILNTHRLDKDAEAESSSDDSDMSDSEMMAMDEKIAEVFKHQLKKKNPKKEKKDAKETVTLFKHRVLDLLAIYAKKEATNPLVLQVLSPLLELIRETKNKELSKKAVDILLGIQNSLKKAKANKDFVSDVDAATLIELLDQVHAVVGKDGSQAYAKSASTASLAIVQRLLMSESEALPKVHEVYGKTMLAWQQGVISFHFSFLADWSTYVQSHRQTT